MVRAASIVFLGCLGVVSLLACDESQVGSSREPGALPPGSDDIETGAGRCAYSDFGRVDGGFVFRCGGVVSFMPDSGTVTILAEDATGLSSDGEDFVIHRAGGVEIHEDGDIRMVGIPELADGFETVESAAYIETEEWQVVVSHDGSVVWWNETEQNTVQIDAPEIFGVAIQDGELVVVHRDATYDYLSFIDLDASSDPYRQQLPFSLQAMGTVGGEPVLVGWDIDNFVSIVTTLDAWNDPQAFASGGEYVEEEVQFMCSSDDGTALLAHEPDEQVFVRLVHDDLTLSERIWLDFQQSDVRGCAVHDNGVSLLHVDGTILRPVVFEPNTP